MLRYSSDDRILTFAVLGPSSPLELPKIFEAIRADPAVAVRSPLLLDVRAVTWPSDEASIRRHLYALHQGLGVKLGAACAILTTSINQSEHHWFLEAAAEVSLRTGVFDDETEARVWLQGYLPEPS
jgi:hypothetical protein